MSAPWEVYEQHCGRGRWVDDTYHSEDDKPPDGGGWYPFAAFCVPGLPCHGTHVVVWRRRVMSPPPAAPVRALKPGEWAT